jgi:hypothetical protein
MDSGLALRAPRNDSLIGMSTERTLVARPFAQPDSGVKID